MLHLVTGGSGSGKSAYAEDIIMKLAKESPSSELIYVATMIPYGDETLKKIEVHKKMRAGKGFTSIECFGGLHRLRWEKDNIILLECMSNLLADEMYEIKSQDPVQEIIKGIEKIIHEAKHLVIVTNEVFSDGIDYDEESVRYIRYLGEINQKMAAMADRVTEVVYGIPVSLKGGE